MKLTTARLKKLIREELGRMSESQQGNMVRSATKGEAFDYNGKKLTLSYKTGQGSGDVYHVYDAVSGTPRGQVYIDQFSMDSDLTDQLAKIEDL